MYCSLLTWSTSMAETKKKGGNADLKRRLGSKPTLRLCLVTFFIFYFQKFVFENIKKKQFFYIFEIKNMFGELKLKKKFFLKKKIENTKIFCY